MGEIPKHTERLAAIGFGELTQAEVLEASDRLQLAITIGLNRTGPPTELDGGLWAIPYPLPPLRETDLAKIPAETAVLAAAFAGTNWTIDRVEYLGPDTPMELTRVYQRPIRVHQRQFVSPDAFADFMAEAVAEGLNNCQDRKVLPILAVGFGFPQINVATNRGVDARLISDDLNKFWRVVGGTGWLVGEGCLQALNQKGIGRFTQVIFGNDALLLGYDQTALVGQPVKPRLLPTRFVFGSGDNGCLVHQDRLFNLEIGQARSILTDPILDEMINSGLVPDSQPRLEFFVGGDFLRNRLGTGLVLAHQAGIIKSDVGRAILASSADSSLVSDLAAEIMTLEEFCRITGSQGDLDWPLLKHCARQVMAKAAQAAVLMVGSVAQSQGWTQGAIGAEGLVIWAGQVEPELSFVEAVRRNLHTVLGNHHLSFVPASSVRGLATLAMTLNG